LAEAVLSGIFRGFRFRLFKLPKNMAFTEGGSSWNGVTRPREVREAILYCESEIDYLKRTANLNLFIGTVVFIFSIGVVTTLLFAPFYAPGLTGVLTNSMQFTASKFIFSASFAAIAFFFLSTYRNAITQVRHYRNEITNILLWQSAMYMSEEEKISEVRKRIITSFLNTERNFVLKKGETTAETQLHGFTRDEAQAFYQWMASRDHDHGQGRRGDTHSDAQGGNGR
jgi:hypothetical protein